MSTQVGRVAHTPGPLAADLYTRDLRGKETWTVRPLFKDGRPASEIVIPDIAEVRGDNPQGDATLFAAAPDLLEACKAFTSPDPSVLIVHTPESYAAALDYMKAAIAKAEGRTP